MAFELQYTSAPRGLLPSQAGYCTVKMTQGIPRALRESLESMSAYHAIFPPGDPRSSQNPVAVSMVHITVQGKRWYVLSRTADAPLDHTHRSNFFAHHVAISPEETKYYDLAALLSDSGTFARGWNGAVEELHVREFSRHTVGQNSALSRWTESFGRGWGEFACQALVDSGTIYIVAPWSAVTDYTLELLQATPPEQRWNLTFSTYFGNLSPTIRCALRGVMPGTDVKRDQQRPNTYYLEPGRTSAAPPVAARAATTGPIGSMPVAEPPYQISAAPPTTKASPSGGQVTSRPVNGGNVIGGMPMYTDSFSSFSSPNETSQGHTPRNFTTGIVMGMLAGVLVASVVATPAIVYFRNESQKYDALYAESKIARARSAEEFAAERDKLKGQIARSEALATESNLKLAAADKASLLLKDESKNLKTDLERKEQALRDSQARNAQLDASIKQLANRQPETKESKVNGTTAGTQPPRREEAATKGNEPKLGGITKPDPNPLPSSQSPQHLSASIKRILPDPATKASFTFKCSRKIDTFEVDGLDKTYFDIVVVNTRSIEIRKTTVAEKDRSVLIATIQRSQAGHEIDFTWGTHFVSTKAIEPDEKKKYWMLFDKGVLKVVLEKSTSSNENTQTFRFTEPAPLPPQTQ